MRLRIFGATGATGQHLVQQALAAGHHVAAFVREPARLTTIHPRLAQVVGDVMHLSSVEAAFGQHDAAVRTAKP